MKGETVDANYSLLVCKNHPGERSCYSDWHHGIKEPHEFTVVYCDGRASLIV